MSIRVNGQTDLTMVEKPRTFVLKSAANDTKATAEETIPGETADRADLSSASGLLELARVATSSAREAKVAAVAARVGSGQYKPAARDVSRALVNRLLNK